MKYCNNSVLLNLTKISNVHRRRQQVNHQLKVAIMPELELTIFSVIEKYQLFIKRAISLLQQAYQCEDVIAARRADTIPRRGEIQGIPFFFHGIGCRMEIDGYIVDW